ncbi:MAG: hypothetical protein ABSF64_14675 [Bryobacteraceae bacterium]
MDTVVAGIVTETVLAPILSYLISLAANFRTDAIFARREKRLQVQLEREEDLRKARAYVGQSSRRWG